MNLRRSGLIGVRMPARVPLRYRGPREVNPLRGSAKDQGVGLPCPDRDSHPSEVGRRAGPGTLSENSERLYESHNGVLGGPHRSAAGGRSGAPETEMAQRRIDFLSLMYKKSSDPGNSPTASRRSARRPTRWPPARLTCAFLSRPDGLWLSPSTDSRSPGAKILTRAPAQIRASLQLPARRQTQGAAHWRCIGAVPECTPSREPRFYPEFPVIPTWGSRGCWFGCVSGVGVVSWSG